MWLELGTFVASVFLYIIALILSAATLQGKKRAHVDTFMHQRMPDRKVCAVAVNFF